MFYYFYLFGYWWKAVSCCWIRTGPGVQGSWQWGSLLPLTLWLPGKRTGVCRLHLGTKLVLPCYPDPKQNKEGWTALGYAGSFSTYKSIHSYTRGWAPPSVQFYLGTGLWISRVKLIIALACWRVLRMLSHARKLSCTLPGFTHPLSFHPGSLNLISDKTSL